MEEGGAKIGKIDVDNRIPGELDETYFSGWCGVMTARSTKRWQTLAVPSPGSRVCLNRRYVCPHL